MRSLTTNRSFSRSIQVSNLVMNTTESPDCYGTHSDPSCQVNICSRRSHSLSPLPRSSQRSTAQSVFKTGTAPRPLANSVRRPTRSSGPHDSHLVISEYTVLLQRTPNSYRGEDAPTWASRVNTCFMLWLCFQYLVQMFVDYVRVCHRDDIAGNWEAQSCHHTRPPTNLAVTVQTPVDPIVLATATRTRFRRFGFFARSPTVKTTESKKHMGRRRTCTAILERRKKCTSIFSVLDHHDESTTAHHFKRETLDVAARYAYMKRTYS